MMRTTKSTVTFHDPFILNRDVGELPAGNYNIEIDEEEIPTLSRTALRRTAIYFYVEKQGSTRTLVIDPGDLEGALSRDAEKRNGTPITESSATHSLDKPAP
jgi:hypothetical protein